MAKMSFLTMLVKMGEGMGRTSAIFFFTLIFALPLGMIVALARMSKSKVLSGIMQVIISILRGTPLMLQLLAVAYGPFYISVGINKLAVANGWDAIAAWGTIGVAREKIIPIIIAFSINYAAYFAEIYRSGIQSMPQGQYEAAEVLGYNKFSTFMRIILPQVIKRILPAMTNEVITLVKDTSLAFTLAYQEMFSIGKSIANSQSSFTPFLIAGLFYYIFNALAAFVMGRIEKRLDYYR